MKTTLKLLLGTAGFLALAKLGSKASGVEDEETTDEEDEDVQLAQTGFQSAAIAEYERELLERAPVDLTDLEDAEPTCGRFFQSKRGNTWLGSHERSITYCALFRSTYMAAVQAGHKDPTAIAKENASNPALRKALFDLSVSQRWGDQVYGTYFLSSKDPVGPHGRGIPLTRFCADNRQRFADGEAAVRVMPRGEPKHRGLGTPNRKRLYDTPLGTLRLAHPYVFIPALNPGKLLLGIVTTRGMSWEEDGTTGLEPPPQIVRLTVAVLS